jgi:hypothetical protein
MLSPSRRRVLLLGSATAACTATGLALSGRAFGAATRPPDFSRWIGRTAVIHADGTEARLHLAADGTGTIAVRMGACWTVPVKRWRIGADGLRLDYLRRAALTPWRDVHGMAVIDVAASCLRWTEDSGPARLALLLGFEAGDATGRC